MSGVVAPAPTIPATAGARAGRRSCNAAGLRIIQAFEGFSARPYVCPAGIWTIGYGATRDAAGRPVGRDTASVGRDVAAALLARDVGDAERAVARLLRWR